MIYHNTIKGVFIDHTMRTRKITNWPYLVSMWRHKGNEAFAEK